VKLGDQEIRAAYYCASEILRSRRLGGQPIPAWLRRWYARLDAELKLSRTRQDFDAPAAELAAAQDLWIGTPEAAALLGWSLRQIQRRATDLEGRIIAGRYVFRESTVRTYAEELRRGDSRGCA
jgi:hypothetical protein